MAALAGLTDLALLLDFAAGLFGFFVGRCARRLPVIDDNLPWTLHRGRFPAAAQSKRRALG